MTLITSPKPSTTLAVPAGMWTPVATSKLPAALEVHALLYANISGRLIPGAGESAAVVQLDVRALRDGYPEGHPDFDETALQTYTALVKADGTWRCRISQAWFGARTMSTLVWQVNPTHPGLVKASRYAKGMSN